MSKVKSYVPGSVEILAVLPFSKLPVVTLPVVASLFGAPQGPLIPNR